MARDQKHYTKEFKDTIVEQEKVLKRNFGATTINKTRDIESTDLNINDNLIVYISNGGETSPDGGGSPSYFV